MGICCRPRISLMGAHLQLRVRVWQRSPRTWGLISSYGSESDRDRRAPSQRPSHLLRCKGSLPFQFWDCNNRDCNKLQPQLRTKNRQHSCNRRERASRPQSVFYESLTPLQPRERALWSQSSSLSSSLPGGTQNGTFGIRQTRNNGLRACPCDAQVSRI